MPHTETTEPPLYYEVHGEGEPLVLVMGLGTDTLGWIPQVPAFSAHHRTVIFDNRDVGRSGYVSEPYEIADMATDTLGLCDELGLESFNLLGLSMGGAIAQEVALRAPERVRTLTLAVTFAGAGRYGAERGRILGTHAQRLSFEEHIDTLLLLTMSEQLYEDQGAIEYLRNAMLSNPNRQPAEGFQRQAAASGNHDARDRLPQLEMPVHVIGAEHDALVPVWKSRELADLIPGAKLTVIDGAPHAVNLERAEELNRAVLDFLDDHREAGAAAPTASA